MELFSFFKQALLSEDFRTIDVYENTQLVFIVVYSDNKTYWQISIYGHADSFDFFAKIFETKKEMNKEIQRILELSYLDISDLESLDYQLID